MAAKKKQRKKAKDVSVEVTPVTEPKLPRGHNLKGRQKGAKNNAIKANVLLSSFDVRQQRSSLPNISHTIITCYVSQPNLKMCILVHSPLQLGSLRDRFILCVRFAVSGAYQASGGVSGSAFSFFWLCFNSN